MSYGLPHYATADGLAPSGLSEANATGNYATVDENFLVTAGVGGMLFKRVIIFIGDDSAGIDADGYGSIAKLASGGITMSVFNANETERVSLCDGVPILRHVDWARLAMDLPDLNYGNASQSFVVCRFSFDRFGPGIKLAEGEHIGVTLRDDFSGLTDHNFVFQGTGARATA